MRGIDAQFGALSRPNLSYPSSKIPPSCRPAARRHPEQLPRLAPGSLTCGISTQAWIDACGLHRVEAHLVPALGRCRQLADGRAKRFNLYIYMSRAGVSEWIHVSSSSLYDLPRGQNSLNSLLRPRSLQEKARNARRTAPATPEGFKQCRKAENGADACSVPLRGVLKATNTLEPGVHIGATPT